jgi:hypothetical protein
MHRRRKEADLSTTASRLDFPRAESPRDRQLDAFQGCFFVLTRQPNEVQCWTIFNALLHKRQLLKGHLPTGCRNDIISLDIQSCAAVFVLSLDRPRASVTVPFRTGDLRMSEYVQLARRYPRFQYAVMVRIHATAISGAAELFESLVAALGLPELHLERVCVLCVSEPIIVMSINWCLRSVVPKQKEPFRPIEGQSQS